MSFYFSPKHVIFNHKACDDHKGCKTCLWEKIFVLLFVIVGSHFFTQTHNKKYILHHNLVYIYIDKTGTDLLQKSTYSFIFLVNIHPSKGVVPVHANVFILFLSNFIKYWS